MSDLQYLKNSVLVCHPGLQHSHQLAWALSDAGLLQQFVSGVPVRSISQRKPFWMPEKFFSKLKIAEIPSFRRRNPIYWWAVMRSCGHIKDPALAHDYRHRVMHWFDQYSATIVLRLRPKVVVAYENSAEKTFLAAKSIGAKCILDAASFHHETSNRIIKQPSRGYLEVVNRRKSAEIRLADLILTCSPLAKSSYVDAGIDAKKIAAIPLGANMPEVNLLRRFSNRPFKFIFAGSMRKLKSIDLIFDAFQIVRSEGYDISLTIAGGSDTQEWIDVANSLPDVEYRGNLSQADLYSEFLQSDCLLLPSQFDSFGMVVAEAMACGVPAIVSSLTGSKLLIEKEPRAGWIVSPDIAGIASGMRSALAGEIDDFESRRKASRNIALEFTWTNYRSKVIDTLIGWA